MPKAIIELDDLDGIVEMKLKLEGGFQAGSNAHQHAYMCLKHLVDQCEAVKTDGKMEYVTMADVDLAQSVPDRIIHTPMQRAIQVVGGR